MSVRTIVCLFLFGVALLIALCGLAVAGKTAYYTGEKVTGQTKQCYYKYADSEYTLTINRSKQCERRLEIE